MFSTYNMTEFGNTLRQVRTHCRLTQLEVQKLTNIHIDTLRKLENGTNIPKYETLELLSNLYKTDLLEHLKSKRSEFRVYDLFHAMDLFLVNEDLENLNPLIFDNPLEMVFFDSNEAAQVKTFAYAGKLIYDSSTRDLNEAKKALNSSLRESIPAFKVNRLKALSFNDLELRILYLLAFAHIELREFSSAISILNYLIHILGETTPMDKTPNRLILKVYCVLTECFFLANKPQNALEIAHKGVRFALAADTFFMVPQLYGYCGIAEEKLGVSTSHQSYSKCKHLFEITGNGDLHLPFIQNSKLKYGHL